jgi:hypothetical protein
MPPHNVDAKDSRIFNLTVNLDPSAPTGNVQLTINWSASLMDINGGSKPYGTGSITTSLFVLSPWAPATSVALQKSPNTWHAGHVNDVLALPGTPWVLLASDTGGVWLVTPIPGVTTPAPIPLSDSWTSPAPNMRSLALGSEGFPHVYAAGYTGALYETKIESSNPLFDWTPIDVVDSTGQPLNTGNINSVVVAPSLRKLVLGADNGVYWADIPPNGHNYAFQPANGIPQVKCHGLVLGPNDGIVASPTGAPGSPASNGMYVGYWRPDLGSHQIQLLMNRAQHGGDIDFTQWNDAVVASCPGNLSTMYAAVSNPTDSVYAILISQDAGTSWKPCGPHGLVAESVNFPAPQTGGDVPGSTQGGYNICIGIAPTDPNTMALGWRRGPWIGRNTPDAFTWEEHGDDGSPGGGSPHLHADIHAVCFDPRDPSGRTLYVASDGGVAVTRDLCQSWDSSINRQLPNFQFWWGGASIVTPGLVAGALQDNGIVYAGAGPNSDSWQRIGPEEDGLLALMLYTDTLLWYTDSVFQAVQASQWNGNGFNPNATVGVRKKKPNTPPLPQLYARNQTFVDPVFHPAAWRTAGVNQRMFAVAIYSPSAPRQDVWGYFSNDDGTNGVWDYVATIALDPNDAGDAVSTIGCDNGSTAYVGTNQGRIYVLDIASAVNTPPGTQAKMGIGPTGWPAGPVQQFSSLPGGSVFARYLNAILRLGLAGWEQLGTNSGLPNDEGSFYGMAVDSMTDTLFIATDFGVWASCDLGDHWLSVSRGLPRHVQSRKLGYARDATGARYLYLTTWGRSAYRSRLSPKR